MGVGGVAVMHVYELPYDVRRAICDLLDADNSWRQLGGRFMGFNETQLTLISHALLRGDSPTNQLLMRWESSNGQVAQLYAYLGHMRHRRAMAYLVPFVEEKWRLLYDEGVQGVQEGGGGGGGGGMDPHQHLGFNVSPSASSGDSSHHQTHHHQKNSPQGSSFYRQQSLNSQRQLNQHSFAGTTTTASTLPPPFPGSSTGLLPEHAESMYNFEQASNLASERLPQTAGQKGQHQQMNHYHQQQPFQPSQHAQAQRDQRQPENPNPKHHHVEFAGPSSSSSMLKHAADEALLPTFTGSFSGRPAFVQDANASNPLASQGQPAEPISQNRHFLHDLANHHHLRHAKTSSSSFSGGGGGGDRKITGARGELSGEGDRTLVDIHGHSSRMRGFSGGQDSSSNSNNPNNPKRSPFSEAASRLKKEKLEYLVRIEDFEIPYQELATATDNFCKDNILGSGGTLLHIRIR